MRTRFPLVATALIFGATGTFAQDCSRWQYDPNGGFEADAPAAYSPCGVAGSVAVLCIGTALMVSFTPAEDTSEFSSNGEHYPISYSIAGFTYSDFVSFMGATGEFSFVRHYWDREHPFFEALQSGSEVKVFMPSLNYHATASLTGSRAAIGQVFDACDAQNY